MTAPRIAVAAQRPVDALAGTGGHRVAAITACEGGPEATLVGDRLGCTVHALEDRLGVRRVWTNATVAEAVAAARSDVALAPDVAVLPYATSRELDRVLAQGGGAVLAPGGALKERIDDKAATRAMLQEIGVAVPASWPALAPPPLGHGYPLIIQRRTGSAGLGTWVVRSDAEVHALPLRAGEPLLLSRPAAGTVCNVHGVVARHGVAVSAPSVQATGVPQLVAGETHYCGNDFGLARALDPAAVAVIRRDVEVTGRRLARDGYAGIFGMDFVVDGPRALALEINPRMQGSTWVLAELERAAGRIGIGDRHVAALAGGTPIDEAPARELDGAMLVLHHLGRTPWRASGGLRPGVHGLGRDDVLEWRRPGLSPADCRAPDEVVVGGLAAPGTVVEPGAVVARVSAQTSLLTLPGDLSAVGAKAVAAIRRAALRPA